MSGVNFTFPAYDLNPGEYVVVAYNAAKFAEAFGFTPLAWDPASFNGLNNTSENIILVDGDSVFVDSVRYADHAPGLQLPTAKVHRSCFVISMRTMATLPIGQRCHRNGLYYWWH